MMAEKSKSKPKFYSYLFKGLRSHDLKLYKLKSAIYCLSIVLILLFEVYYYYFRGISYYKLIVDFAIGLSIIIFLIETVFLGVKKIFEVIKLEIDEKSQIAEASRYRTEFSRLVTAISTKFINLALSEIDAGINNALQELGEFAGVDRSYVFLFQPRGNTVDNTHEWCAPGIESRSDSLKGLPTKSLPVWMGKLNRFENIYFPRIADLPAETVKELELFGWQNNQSLLVVPISFGNDLIGFLGFDSLKKEMNWPQEVISLLRIAGEIFANAMKRKEAELIVKQGYRLQTVLYQVADKAATAKDLDALFQSLYEYLKTVIDVTNIYIAFYDIDKDVVSFPYWIDEKDSCPQPRAPGKGLTGLVLKTGKALFATKELMLSMGKEGIIDIIGTPSEVWLGAPLKIEDRSVGVMAVQSYTDKSLYTEKDLAILEFVSGQIASAIVHIKASQALSQSEKKYRSLAEELSESNSIKELLLDILTHDLKNPAGVISGMSDLVLQDDPDKEALQFIKDSSDNLLRVIDLASTLSKTVIGEDLQMQELDLAELIKNTIDEFMPTIENAGMKVVNNLKEPLFVKANPIIAEVFKNYISNAIKHAAKGRKIIIDKAEFKKSIVIKIKDFGSSIPEEQRDKVFERYTQLKKGVKLGRGLGLAIVKRIAEIHGGKVGVEPNKPNGNVFYLELPNSGSLQSK